MAIRTPTPDGSIVDLSVIVAKDVSVEKVNEAFKKAAGSGPLSITLEFMEDPIVSTDIIGNPHGSIVDGALTAVNGNLVKVYSWYDNEYGFCCRMIDLVQMML